MPDSPQIASAEADQAFRTLVKSYQLNPDNPWIGGYVDFEWQHSRYLFEALENGVTNRKVLEFGCNVGASAIVLALLNAKVTALEIDPQWLDLARANARRYGMENAIDFIQVTDSRLLPFADGEFELITCNSVLEYVNHQQLAEVLRELDRVLKPGGIIMITGTSNRLWPYEPHGQHWFINYWPRAWDRFLFGDRHPERGVWPWQLRYGFGPDYRDLDCLQPELYQTARMQLMPSPVKQRIFKTLNHLLRPFCITPNWLGSSIAMTLQKPLASSP